MGQALLKFGPFAHSLSQGPGPAERRQPQGQEGLGMSSREDGVRLTPVTETRTGLRVGGVHRVPPWVLSPYPGQLVVVGTVQVQDWKTRTLGGR